MEIEFYKTILPETKQIATIRNYIEHKLFKIVEIGETKISDNGLIFQVKRDEFQQKRVYPNADGLISNYAFVFAIRLEEKRKRKN